MSSQVLSIAMGTSTCMYTRQLIL